MHRRTLLRAALLAPAAAAVPVLQATTAEAAPTVSRTIASGLDTPWSIAFLPSGDALVSERDSGWITLVHASGGFDRVKNLTVTHTAAGEDGLLGLALHPDFATNRLVYAYLSTDSDNRVVRMAYVGGQLSDPEPVLTGIPHSAHHNGGGLLFDPHGYLFVSAGDARDSSLAQDKSSRGGKILRIDPETGAAAPGNPFGTRVWTYGHRNPEGITFAPSGDLWASEFGENTWDELNHIVAGRNYGWPRQEGKDGRGGYTDPLAQWHPENCSPSGIVVTHGRAWLAALRGESLWSVVLNGPHRGERTRHFSGRFGRLRALSLAPDGSLWLGTSNRDGRGNPAGSDDRILRIVL